MLQALSQLLFKRKKKRKEDQIPNVVFELNSNDRLQLFKHSCETISILSKMDLQSIKFNDPITQHIADRLLKEYESPGKQFSLLKNWNEDLARDFRKLWEDTTFQMAYATSMTE